MEETIRDRLARALGVEPGAVERYRQEEDGRYTVLLSDFRKVTAVQPAPPEAPATPGDEPQRLPAALVSLYERPLSGSKAQLVDLAKALGLPATGTKKQLVARIDAHRGAH